MIMKSLAIIAMSAALAAFGTTSYAQTSAAESPPNDAQIAQIVLTADTVDIDYGKMAAKKTSNPEVKAFAETMVRDHSAVNDKATALAKKLGVTPEASATSKSLKADGDKMLAKLKAMHGAEFDKAYIDNEVSYHEAVIAALDKTLLPNAKNAELKSLLETGRPIFASHLEHAKQLQKSLNK
jgi:putative membrane protein